MLNLLLQTTITLEWKYSYIDNPVICYGAEKISWHYKKVWVNLSDFIWSFYFYLFFILVSIPNSILLSKKETYIAYKEMLFFLWFCCYVNRLYSVLIW